MYRKYPAATPSLLFCGGVLQVIGVGLLSTLPTGPSVSNSQYGFEVMTGIGFGLMLPSFMILARDWVPEQQYGNYNLSPFLFFADHSSIATAMGLVNTFRTLGGCVSIAVCGAILNQELDKGFTITNRQSSYGDIYNKQFFVMAILSIPSALAASIILLRQYCSKGVFSLDSAGS